MTSTKAISPGSGAQYFSSNVPAAVSYDAVNALGNYANNAHYERLTIQNAADTNVTSVFTAPAKGRVLGILFCNGATAQDGSNSTAVTVTNVTNSSDVIGSFSMGGGTNAAAATNKAGTVAANGTAQLNNSNTGRFNKGDKLTIVSAKDGTTGASAYTVIFEYSATGR